MQKAREVHGIRLSHLHRRSSRVSLIDRYAQALRDLKEAEYQNRLLEDVIEDMQLNAIADARAKGPFVEVALDDL